MTISILLNALFVFFIIESSIAIYVLGRDSVPDALINSSTESGRPAEYNADSSLAVASSCHFHVFAIFSTFYSIELT